MSASDVTADKVTSKHESDSFLPSASSVLNVNIGVLGHIDSGKTSLCAAISTTASTACFDKSKQSKERGITLDVGFSCFYVPIPSHGAGIDRRYTHYQYTLVDCPGHASLIKTVLGGARIIDMMIIVMDINKGIQTQTAECLVICKVLNKRLIVVLNKLDLIEESKRNSSIEKVKKKLLKTLYSMDVIPCAIVALSTQDHATANSDSSSSCSPLPGSGIDELIYQVSINTTYPQRSPNGPFLFSVDHCFIIIGKGTIITGTVLNGCLRNNDIVEIPSIGIERKVKSIQMFKQPVTEAIQGDRIGICVPQFDAKLLERGLACTPGTTIYLHAAIISITKIPYFKFPLKSKSKFHISIGYDTSISQILLFSEINYDQCFDLSNEFQYLDDYDQLTCTENDDNTTTTTTNNNNNNNFANGACNIIPGTKCKKIYALLEFEKSIICTMDSHLIGAKLDIDIHGNSCRLAFEGKILFPIKDKNYRTNFLQNLKIIKYKQKIGLVERLHDDTSLIVKELFKKETKFDLFIGKKVLLSTGEEGNIESTFGTSGKVKIRFYSGLFESTKLLLQSDVKNKKNTENIATKPVLIQVTLQYKKYCFGTSKFIAQ